MKAFRKRIGSSFSQAELDSIYEEGAKRYRDNLPPGHKDAGKDLSENEPKVYQVEDKSYRRAFGDLILWKEILRKVKAEEIQYVALVTNDTKENWLEERRGKVLGVRHELLNEIYFEAKCVKLFHIYDTYNFMQYAKDFLQINVTDRSIAETKELLNLKIMDPESLRPENYQRHTLLFGGAEPDFGEEQIGAVRFYFGQHNSVEIAHHALREMLHRHKDVMTEVAVDVDDAGFYAETAFTVPMPARAIERLSRTLRQRGLSPSTYVIEPWSES